MPRHRNQRQPCVLSRSSNAIIAASELTPATPPSRVPELPNRFAAHENQPWMLFNLLASRARHNINEDQMVLEALRVIRTLVDKYVSVHIPAYTRVLVQHILTVCMSASGGAAYLPIFYLSSFVVCTELCLSGCVVFCSDQV